MSVRIVSDGTTQGTAKAVITVDNVAVDIRTDEVRTRNVGDEQ